MSENTTDSPVDKKLFDSYKYVLNTIRYLGDTGNVVGLNGMITLLEDLIESAKMRKKVIINPPGKSCTFGPGIATDKDK